MVVEATDFKPANACPGRVSSACEMCIHHKPDHPNTCDPDAKLVLKPDVPFSKVRGLLIDTLNDEVLQSLASIRIGISLLKRPGNLDPAVIERLESAFCQHLHGILAVREVCLNEDLSIPIKNRYGTTSIDVEKIYVPKK